MLDQGSKYPRIVLLGALLGFTSPGFVSVSASGKVVSFNKLLRQLRVSPGPLSEILRLTFTL